MSKTGVKVVNSREYTGFSPLPSDVTGVKVVNSRVVFVGMCFVGHVPVHRMWQHMQANTTIVANLVFTNLYISAVSEESIDFLNVTIFKGEQFRMPLFLPLRKDTIPVAFSEKSKEIPCLASITVVFLIKL